MDGKSVIADLKKKFELNTDRQLADFLGITTQRIQLWKNRESITARQLSGLIAASIRASEKRTELGAIRPLVEFFELDKCESKHGAKYELFGVKNGGKDHPYLTGLRDELDSHHGVYVFFDSRGHSIYAGKARKTSLWKEMTSAFNRDRGEVQKIKRVYHPSGQKVYKTSEEKNRKIISQAVALHEMATYFSAYKVADGMVDEVEAMLVRGFANDLLNIRMEQFGSQRAPKK